MASLSGYSISGIRTRTLLITIISMLSIGVLVAIYSFTKNNTDKSISSNSSIPSNISITPGAKSSQKYSELQQAANIIGTKNADAKGKTFIPTIINSANEQSGKAFQEQLSSLLKEKEGTKDYEKLSKQLAGLLAELNMQGQEINNLLRLLRELQNQGYDISDLERLLRSLTKDGYNTDELAKLLALLSKQGYAINDLENLLKRLLKEGYDPNLINKILEQLLKDRLKALEEAIRRLQEGGYNTKDPSYVAQVNDPDFSKLLSQLANQGYKIDALEDLLKQLMEKGYNIFNLSVLFNQLKKDGYKVDKFESLIDQGQKSGKKITDMTDLLNALSKKNEPEPKKENQNKSELTTLVNLDKQVNSNLSEAERKYAEIVKQQQEKALAAIEEQKNKERMLKTAEERKFNNQQSTINSETRRKDMEAIFANMNTVADNLTSALNKTPEQSFVQGELKDEAKMNQLLQNIQPQVRFDQNKALDNKDQIIKAGTILFAVLETSVNSDEPGPILARIVQKPLLNASLLGSIQPANSQYAEGLVLNFATISIPDRIRSYSISAVAVDPNNSRVSIATDVDHHYLLRWGTIFAASFLQGYSKAISQSGTTIDTTISGATTNTVTKQSPLNGKQQFYQGLADVASTWGKGVSSFSNRPNTITIDTGTSLGILLTSDFTIPFSDKSPTDQEPPYNQQTIQNQQTDFNQNPEQSVQQPKFKDSTLENNNKSVTGQDLEQKKTSQSTRSDNNNKTNTGGN
jgi:Bacterial conjugation TrbI-like protein